MSILDAPPRSYATRGGVALAPAPQPRPPAGPAAPRNPRHLRVVAPAERVRRRLTPATGVVLTALVFVTLFAVAISQTLLVQGQIRLDALDSQLSTEQARYQELRKDVAEAESPARVVAAAEALGMVTPEDLVYLQPDVSDDTTGSDGTEGTTSTVEATSGADGGGQAARAGAGRGPAGAGMDEAAAPSAPRAGWSTMKPLLEAPAP